MAKYRLYRGEDKKSKVRLYDRDRQRLKRSQAKEKAAADKKRHAFHQACYKAKKSDNGKVKLAETIVKKVEKEFDVCDKGDNVVQDMLVQLQANKIEEINELHKKYRIIKSLRSQNRFKEHKEMVDDIKNKYGSYDAISELLGIPSKTLCVVFNEPKVKLHKATAVASKRKGEIGEWWRQDFISTPLGSFRYGQKRYSTDSADKLYALYEKDEKFHQHGKMSKTVVKKYRPKEVKPVRKTPLIQCLCFTCSNICLALQGLRKARLSCIPKDEFEMFDKCVCADRFQMAGNNIRTFPNLKCALSKCKKCGVAKALHEITQVNHAQLHENPVITWEKWINKSRSPTRIIVSGLLSDLVTELQDQLDQKAIEHIFMKEWQKHQFLTLKRTLTPGIVLQVLDFSQNFANIMQNEVQSVYWDRTTTSIHGTAMYYKCPIENCSERVLHEVIHVSNDHKHDSYFVEKVEQDLLVLMKDFEIAVNKIVQFVDNAGFQFKAVKPFYNFAKSVIEKIRCYFAASHGKGPADAIFGRIKPQVKQAIISGKVTIRHAKDWFNYAKEHLSNDAKPPKGVCKHHFVTFRFVEPMRHEGREFWSVTGTQKFYQIRSVGKDMEFQSRDVACVCQNCLNGQSNCLNPNFTHEWKRQRIQFKSQNVRKRPLNLRSRTSDVDEANTEQGSDSEEVHSTVIDECETEIEASDASLHCDREQLNIDSDDSDLDVIVLCPEKVDTLNLDNPEPENCPLSDEDCLKLLQSWSQCESYADLEEAVSNVELSHIGPVAVTDLPIAQSYHRTDSNARAEMGRNLARFMRPIETTGDGNCWYRATSSALFAFEEMHIALRLLLVVEAVKNMDKYLSDDFMKKGAKITYAHSTIPEIFCLYSPYHNCEISRASMTAGYIKSLQEGGYVPDTCWVLCWHLAACTDGQCHPKTY